MIRVKRIYEPAEPDDGYRVLVDRLWPRGIGKEAARLDEWLREIAPGTGLRRWFHADPARWEEFKLRYRAELAEPACAAHLDRLRRLAQAGTVTLLYAARDEAHNHALLVRELLQD